MGNSSFVARPFIIHDGDTFSKRESYNKASESKGVFYICTICTNICTMTIVTIMRMGILNIDTWITGIMPMKFIGGTRSSTSV